MYFFCVSCWKLKTGKIYTCYRVLFINYLFIGIFTKNIIGTPLKRLIIWLTETVFFNSDNYLSNLWEDPKMNQHDWNILSSACVPFSTIKLTFIWTQNKIIICCKSMKHKNQLQNIRTIHNKYITCPHKKIMTLIIILSCRFIKLL